MSASRNVLVNLSAKQAEAASIASASADGPGIASADNHAGHNHLDVDPNFVTGDILEDDGAAYDDTVGYSNFYGANENDYSVAKRSVKRPVHRPMRHARA